MWLVKLLQHESIDDHLSGTFTEFVKLLVKWLVNHCNMKPGTSTELVKLLVKWLVKPLQHEARHIY